MYIYINNEIEELIECAKKIPILNNNENGNDHNKSISKLITIFKSKQRSRSSSFSLDTLNFNLSSSSSNSIEIDDENPYNTNNNNNSNNNNNNNNNNCNNSNNSNNNKNINSLDNIDINNNNKNNFNDCSSYSSFSSSECLSDIGNSCIDSLELFRLSDDIEEESEMIFNQVGPDRYNDLANIFSKSHKNLTILLKDINRDTLDCSECIDGSLSDNEWEKCLCCGDIHSLGDYKHVECIGKGGYGVVCKFINKKTNEIRAIKTIRKDYSALKEINTLKELGGQFTVNIFHTFLSPCKEKVLIEMEYLSGGDCAFHLNDVGVGFPEELAKQYTAETVLCLDFIHEKSIIHCDIKPNNMVIDSDGHIKLLDFGNAKKFNQKKPTSNDGILGSPRYISPEVLLFEPQSPAVDYWSLGIVMFELITGTTPFIGETPEEIFESILSRNTECIEIQKDAKDLIIKLLDPNPSTRIGSKDIKNHPYFNGINWDTIKTSQPIWKPNSSNNFITSINGCCKLINSF
ncbi:hypothetical protein DDB_G0293276 [Dictyostelium discoideum AX4]|uniref:Probable serine/threonine-protein kinase DDB_G0293276 n=1 Tax=Dictyostelium discoideum TaxID=44689 RepID=Y9452_DICDI|nr:hypothetical protein DDB_G0293276 [Dictyostelium discoideum AX4]Q54C18.1 RecName: Full=Probable serine/threonine-protein kinase DDB_G0293276 [Dictyostelium discoideum]EAL60837.1 hypothetical protein DDB_G0293276 [Dictyostelium discoideum AX4]|eukprot:XP_629248.1 hypothetical protein DDB_G0293276 [Dictyostelium discoideum AX4]